MSSAGEDLERAMASLLPFQRQVQIPSDLITPTSELALHGNGSPLHVLQMVEELIREDGMCIMSAGLGWQKTVAVILRLHMERRR